ncbi:MAG: protein kinase, partial [Rhodothermia bacterium]|nr:protein kinase [Rhodothermia bacterium]
MVGQKVSHYEITERLGGGGMGIVYKAVDLKLQRQVALKFLPSHLSADRTAKARFIQEARAASALEDDNICTIHEIGETSDGRLFIAMAYYDGETLKSRIERWDDDPISPRDALSIAVNIAEGLHAAHSRGIVHRDIKPANVMLTERMRAKILDFGLAKLGTSMADLTKAGSTLGTTSYMSPEQARGEEVGPEADVWSLGVVLYEMLSGLKPFTGDYEQAVTYAILNEEPRGVSEVNPDVPPDLAGFTARCLEKERSRRWKLDEAGMETLRQLRESLSGSGVSRVSGSSSAFAPIPKAWYHSPAKLVGVFAASAVVVLGLVYAAMIQFGLPDWVFVAGVVLMGIGLPIIVFAGQRERRAGGAGASGFFNLRNAVYGGLAAFMALGAFSTGYMVMRAAGIGPAATLVSAGVLDSEEQIILADFDNTTNDPALGQSITDLLRIDLNQSNILSLTQPPTVAAVLGRMGLPADTLVSRPLAREIAQREGVKAVLVGEVSPVGTSFAITAELISAEDGRTLVALRETADNEGEIIKAVDRLSAGVREQIGESLKTIRSSAPLDRVSTTSLAALKKYGQAERAETAGDWDRAIRLLRESIALDSTFAMAYRKLAVVLGNSLSDNAGQLAAAKKAFEYRERLPEKERLQTMAYYYFSAEYQPDRVESAYREILELDPDDRIALNNLTLLLNRQERYDEALSFGLRSIETNDHWTHYAVSIGAAIGLDSLDLARQLAEEYAERVGGPHAIRMQI